MSCEEKAVNTRSQGVTSTTVTQSGDEGDAATTTTDNSLMARRRRRRERAQTAYIMHAHGQSVDGVILRGTQQSTAGVTSSSSSGSIAQHAAAFPPDVEGHQMTLAERRLLRAAFSLSSVDADDVFYDAVNSAAHKQL